MPQAMAPYASGAAASLAADGLGAGATLGISAAVDAALIALHHYVGQGRRTANSLTRGLQQEFTDQVLAPLAVVNQTDPEAAHALMEAAWPKALQQFQDFASQGKNQAKVVDQMFKTPAWISTVTSIMGRNPFTSQPPAPRQDQAGTTPQDQPPAETQSVEDPSRVQLPDVNANAPDATEPNTPPTQGTPPPEDRTTLPPVDATAPDYTDPSTPPSQGTPVAPVTIPSTAVNVTAPPPADIPPQQQAGPTTTTNPMQDMLGHAPTTAQDYQGSTNVTNPQNYVSSPQATTNPQNYMGAILGLLPHLFAGPKKTTTPQKQDQAGPTTQGYGDIYNVLTGGNVRGSVSGVNTQTEDTSQVPALLKLLGYNGQAASTPTAQPNTMQSMLQQLMQLQKGAA